MARVAVCTDSSALLTDAEAARLGVVVVPIAVVLDGVPFDERGTGLDRFYDRLAAGGVATTSQPSPGEFLDGYAALAEAGASQILSIHLDRRLSGTAAAAELATREAPVPVTVVDVATASFGVVACVREAAARLAAGASAADAAHAARELAPRLRNAFVAAGMGGRVPGGAGWDVLQLAGGATPVRAARETLDDAVAAMVELVSRSERPAGAAVGHAASRMRPAADDLARRLSGVGIAVERYRVGAAVGAHTGGLSFGAFWWS